MPVPAEEVWRPYSDRLRDNLAVVQDQYLIVRGSPTYWRGKRVLTLEKRITESILNSQNVANDFYSRDAQELMLAGMRAVRPGVEELSPAAARELAQMVEDSQRQIMVAQREALKDTRRWTEMVQNNDVKKRGLITKLNHGFVRGRPRLSSKGFQPGMYEDLMLRADSNTFYNRGVILQAREDGVKYVRISDGADCGLLEHDDPNLADGLIMKIDEAYQYPIAHPSCQRTFVIDDDTRGRKRSGRSSKASTKAAAVAVGITATAAAGMLALRYNQALQRTVTEYLARNSREFATYHTRYLQQTQINPEDLLNSARADQWAAFYGEDVSAISRQYLRVPTARKVVGDDFDALTDFTMERRYQIFGDAAMNFENSVAQNVFSLISDEVGNVNFTLPKIFSAYPSLGMKYRDVALRAGKGGFGGSVSRTALNDILRFGYAKGVRNEHGIPYIGIRPHQLVRYRLSKVKHGFANRVVMNPNGMLRAGFAIDPRNGYIIPNLALIPKGPLRVNTYLNRVPGRQVQGTINTVRLRRALRKTSKGALSDAPLVSMDELLERGLGEHSGRLKVGDFGEGVIENLMSVAVPGVDPGERIIGYGVIRNALDVGDELVDLEIRNGKFRTNVVVGTGRITSISTEVRLMLPKSAVASIRFNTNLRQLGLDSLKDLRHLNWSQIKSLRHANTRIVSLALELRAMRYTPLEISKVLRMKATDIERMLREGDKFFLDAALNTVRKYDRYIPGRWRADVYDFLTKEIFKRDTRPVHERLGITPNQLDRLWMQAQTSWDRIPMHGMEGDEVANLLSNQIIDAASMVMSLTDEDVALALFPVGRKNFQRAAEVRDLAAVMLMRETVKVQPELAGYWGRAVFINQPEFVRAYDKGIKHLEDVKARLKLPDESQIPARPVDFDQLSEFDQFLMTALTSVDEIPEEALADIAAAVAIARDRFPNIPLPKFVLGGEIDGIHDWSASYNWITDEVQIPTRYLRNWRNFDYALKGSLKPDDEWGISWTAHAENPIGVLVHEIGHKLHLGVADGVMADINKGVMDFLLNLKTPGVPEIVTTAPPRVVRKEIKRIYTVFADVTDEAFEALEEMSPEARLRTMQSIMDEAQFSRTFGTGDRALAAVERFFDPEQYGLLDLTKADGIEWDHESMNYWYRLYRRYNPPQLSTYLARQISSYSQQDFYEFIAESVAHSLAGPGINSVPLNVTRIVDQAMRNYSPSGGSPVTGEFFSAPSMSRKKIIEEVASGKIVDPDDYDTFDFVGGTLGDLKDYPDGSPMQAAQDWTLWLEGLLNDEPIRVARTYEDGTIPELDRIRESYEKALDGEEDSIPHGKIFLEMMDSSKKTSQELYRAMSLVDPDKIAIGETLDWGSINSASEDRYYAENFLDMMYIEDGEPALFKIAQGAAKSFPLWRLLGPVGEEHILSGMFRVVSKTFDDGIGGYIFEVEQVKDHRGRLI